MRQCDYLLPHSGEGCDLHYFTNVWNVFIINTFIFYCTKIHESSMENLDRILSISVPVKKAAGGQNTHSS